MVRWISSILVSVCEKFIALFTPESPSVGEEENAEGG